MGESLGVGVVLATPTYIHFQASLASHDYFLWERVWSNCYTLLVTHVQENLGRNRIRVIKTLKNFLQPAS